VGKFIGLRNGANSSMISDAIYPQAFASAGGTYWDDPLVKLLADFFIAKGLPALKEEDRTEKWYEDWLAYQARHQIYARLLAPIEFSTLGGQLDLLRLTRFLEVFGYFSPAHGYSLQVSFLGLFPILMGDNVALKREAIAALETGKLFAFGVSEKEHGSDLFGNEFTVTETSGGRLVANGAKYYIGNSNCAAMISILARKMDQPVNGRTKRAPFILFALRPGKCGAFKNNEKIRTLGVRAAFVGGFEVKDHALSETDIFSQGRDAWDAVFGTVTLGKFFLGFGSIGICEHALEESVDHLRRRILYGKPVIEMPHIRLAAAQAYARLAGMKLFAYRALDYVQFASAGDRRYLLYLAIQKAKVSTEGVKVIAQLSECIGAKGFESETYFEMALRDVQLIPGLEGSTHINLAFAAQFIPRYFAPRDGQGERKNVAPPSYFGGEMTSGENPYLMQARAGVLHSITFGYFLEAYRPLATLSNVRRFVAQAKAFARLMRRQPKNAPEAGSETNLAVGLALATIVYAQLVAENAIRLMVAPAIVNAIFHLLVADLTTCALQLAALPQAGPISRALVKKMVRIPKTAAAEWEEIAGRLGSTERIVPSPNPVIQSQIEPVA
jgi:acyl-CoA dehydrogenase